MGMGAGRGTQSSKCPIRAGANEHRAALYRSAGAAALAGRAAGGGQGQARRLARYQNRRALRALLLPSHTISYANKLPKCHMNHSSPSVACLLVCGRPTRPLRVVSRRRVSSIGKKSTGAESKWHHTVPQAPNGLTAQLACTGHPVHGSGSHRASPSPAGACYSTR